MGDLEDLVERFDALKPDAQLSLCALLIQTGQEETAMQFAKRVVEMWEIAKLRGRRPAKGARA